ncbi:hypothetical protein DFJ73DRAFT_815533 [Zopfochytrium polystomum]|nr:hypothetical protein DFJ73DRAFT_815533 [Zopfochytrium polystomum]
MDSHQFISLSQAVAFLSQTELRTPCHFGFVVGRDLLRFAAQSTEEYAEWEERILQALPSLNRARGPPLAEEDGRDVRIGGRKMRKQGKASPAPRTNSGIAPIFQRLRKSHSVDRLSSSNSHNPVTNGWRAGAAFMARFKPSTSSPPVESTEAPNPSPSPNVPDSDEIRARKPGQSSAPTVELDIKERLPPLNLRMSSLIPAEWVANPGSSDESATKNKEETLSDGGQRTHNAASNAAVGAKGSSPPRFTRFMRSDSIVYAFGSKAPDTSLDVVDMEKQPTSSPQMVWSKDFQRFLSFDVSGRSSERS